MTTTQASRKSTTSLTLDAFAKAVGCHFTSASRLRAGTRYPGRALFNKIVKTYNLDPNEALTAYCGPMDEFGAYMQAKVFNVIAEDIEADRAKHGTPAE